MSRRNPACGNCGSGDDVLRIRSLHEAGDEADVCRPCVESAASDLVPLRDSDAKVSAIRATLDKGLSVWHTDDEPYVVPPNQSASWRRA